MRKLVWFGWLLPWRLGPLIKNLWFLLKGRGERAILLQFSFNSIQLCWWNEENEEWNERSEPGLVAFSSLSFQFSKAIQSKTLIDCSWMKKRKEERPSPSRLQMKNKVFQLRRGPASRREFPSLRQIKINFIYFSLLRSFNSYFYNKWNSRISLNLFLSFFGVVWLAPGLIRPLALSLISSMKPQWLVMGSASQASRQTTPFSLSLTNQSLSFFLTINNEGGGKELICWRRVGPTTHNLSSRNINWWNQFNGGSHSL